MGGSQLHLSHQHSQQCHRSAQPMPSSAHQRSGAGVGRSVGHRPRLSRHHSHPHHHTARCLARSAHQRGTRTPRGHSAVPAGTDLVRVGTASVLLCTCCQDDNGSALVTPFWLPGAGASGYQGQGALTSSCSPAALQHRLGRQSHPRSRGTQWGASSGHLPWGRRGGQPHSSPVPAPQ